MGLAFINTVHLKTMYKLATDTPILKLNLILALTAGVLVWYMMQFFVVF